MERRARGILTASLRLLGGSVLAIVLMTCAAVGGQEPTSQLPDVGGEIKILSAEAGGGAKPVVARVDEASSAAVEADWSETASRAEDSPFLEVWQGPQRPAAVEAQPVRFTSHDYWTWQVLPDGLIYQSYLAGVKEPRFAAAWVYDRTQGPIWDISLGGRVGVLRYGTSDRFRPNGWQVDLEGAAMPRLDMEESLDLMATDFRFGVPVTYGRGPYQTKVAYYHLSSHLGDEIVLKHPEVERINYSRNALVWGHSYYWTDALRLYGEAAWAFFADGGSDPWEFQFGIDYSPPLPTGRRPVPFFAVNGHLREEVRFGGNVSVQSGWLWRGETGHLLRAGMQYYTGKSDQYEFFNQFENKIGLGIWYDY